MIFIFDQDERLVAALENKDGAACPIEKAIIKEKLNGEFSLEFEIPEAHPDIEFIKERYYAAIEDTDGTFQLFIIAEIKDSHKETLVKNVYCDHASVELNDEIIEELLIEEEDSDIAAIMIMDGSRWSLGLNEIDPGAAAHDLTARITSRKAALSTFLDRWGMEIGYHFTISKGAITGRFIDIHIERGARTGKRIEYEKDTEEITRTVRADYIKTALYGIGQSYNPASTKEGEEVEAEKKLKTDFSGLDWSTETRTVTKNMLQPYQANPTAADHLRRWTRAGYLDITFSTSLADLPPDIEGAKASVRIEQKQAVSPYMAIGTGFKKTVIEPNKYYTASVYARTNYVGELEFYVDIYNKDNKLTDKVFVSTHSMENNTWYRFSINFLSPVDAYYGLMELRKKDAEIGNAVRWACAQFEYGLLTDWIESGRQGSQPFNKPAGQKWVGDEDARLKYGRLNTITGQREHVFGVYENSSLADPALLLIETKAELDKLKEPQISYEVKEIAIGELLGYDHERARIGDTIYMIDRDLELQHETRCIEREVDLIEKSDIDLVFGNFKPALTAERLAEIEKIKADIINAPTAPFPEGVLEEGTGIKTSWLEGKIEALQNEILAGNGTVTITENNGILIENDEKTEALRLLAGKLALANEVDPETGLYNWRAFGTGDGFLADLVETGFLKFDRSQGGTLTLGGELIGYEASGAPIFENGRLIVTDGEVETVTLDGSQGGFDKLFIGEIRGDNVVTHNNKGDLFYWVNPVTGDDENDGSSGAPLKRLQAAIDKIPQFNNSVIKIQIQVGDLEFVDNATIKGIDGSGRIEIILGWNNTMLGAIDIRGVQNEVKIMSLPSGYVSNAASNANRSKIFNQNITSWSAPLYAHRAAYIYLYDIVIDSNNLCTYGIYSNASYIRTELCEVYNVTHSCAVAAYGARMDITNCAGYGPQGVYVVGGSVVGGYGRGFWGSTAHVLKTQGGVCDVAQIAWTYSMGAATPPVAPIKTSTYTANDTQSLFGSNWTLTDYVYQGKRPTEATPWYGVFFFNAANFSDLKNGDLTNRPIKSVRLLIQRTSDTGNNNARYPRFYYNMQTAASGAMSSLQAQHDSGTGFLWGEEKWVTLPNSYGEAFQNGTAKSLVIYRGSDEGNYMRFMAKATLEIVHG